jgi:spermidine/putrescine transport system permease protein
MTYGEWANLNVVCVNDICGPGVQGSSGRSGDLSDIFRVAVVIGIVYVYLPFMLFPLVIGIAMVPDSLREAAADLGASRYQIFREVELPLSLPGILIGCLLTFILALGSLAESKILGGQAIITIAHDIESAFTFAQNWPRGSVLSVVLIALTGTAVFFLFRRLDLDRIVGRR